MAGADVVVVGGGVVGCSCALELAGRGLGVVLVERAELAAGASGRNHGLLFTPWEPQLLPMARATLEAYREAVAEAAVPFLLDRDPIGYLIVASTDEEDAQARTEGEAAAACGVPTERVDGRRLRELEPELSPSFDRGWLLEDGRRLDPAALTVSLALAARRRGAEVRHHVAARALLASGGTVRGVVTDDGPIFADRVVLAAGPWSSGLLRPLGTDLPIVGARGWIAHLAPGVSLLSRIVEQAGWHVLPGREAVAPLRAGDVAEGRPEPEVGTLLHPGVDGSLVAGGSRQLPAVHEPEDHDVARQIVRRAVRLVPALAGADVVQAWWGVRPMSPDGLPIVGEVAPGLVVATGHGSQGVILAGGTGRLVASIVTGEEPPFDRDPLSPDRFGRR